MATAVKFSRVDTAANFTAASGVVTPYGAGELLLESDTNRVKWGDGVSDWNALPYRHESSIVENPANTFTFTDELGNTISWTVGGGGGGGVTDHGLLNAASLLDDDHPQYHNDARGDARYFTQAQITSQQGVQDAAISLNTAKVSFPEAPTDGQQYARQSSGWAVVSPPIFGSEFEEFTDTSNDTVTSGTNLLIRNFTTQPSPAGKYRIQMEVQIEPGSTSNNYRLQLRIDGAQIGLEGEDEGKDVGGDIRRLIILKGYYTHTGTGTFDIELWASRDSGSLVIHGNTAEKWRVT